MGGELLVIETRVSFNGVEARYRCWMLDAGFWKTIIPTEKPLFLSSIQDLGSRIRSRYEPRYRQTIYDTRTYLTWPI